ncbi:MAG: SDR family oxidoreductase [Phycisphaerae bacterium]
MASVNIAGKNILVTGANRGIGLEIVKALVREGVAKVYAAVRNPASVEGLRSEFGECIVPLVFDLTDGASIKAAAGQASDVHVVICNAGVLRTATAFSDDALDALAFEIDANVMGLIRTAQAFAPVLKANGGGALVQLNSVVSMKCFPEFTTYCASKAASYSITQSLRSQLADQGTSVFSVHPGPIATDMGDAAGLTPVAEPPSLVADAIIEAFKSGEFHVWPDRMAKQIGTAYEGFAKGVVESDMQEG